MSKWQITMRVAGMVYAEVEADTAEEVAALAVKVAESIWRTEGEEDWRVSDVSPRQDCEREVAR